MDNQENKENSNINNNEINNEKETQLIKEKGYNTIEEINEEKINIARGENEAKNEILENNGMDKNKEENKEKDDLINKNINKEKINKIENTKDLINLNKTDIIVNEEKIKDDIIKSEEIKNLEEKDEEKADNKKIEEIKNLEKEIKEKENEKIDTNNIKIIQEENNNKKQNEIKENEIKNLDIKIIEKISKYSESNYKEFITEKHFCDYNTGEEWRSGYIISISNNNAIIIDAINPNYSKKIININDRKNISFIRKYSLPDNDMAKGSSKNLKSKLYQFLGFHNNFENYMNNCSNFDFYYFLRVTVYYGLDFCMNVNIESNDIFTSFKLILVIMDIIIDCLKFIEKNFKDFLYFETSIKNTELADLVLFDKKFAIFSFFDDIHFLLKKIFADSPKYLDWYIQFKKEINKFNPAMNTKGDIDSSKYNIPLYQDGTLKKICINKIYDNELHKFYTLDKEISTSIIAYFADYFSHNDGFKILFKLIYSFDMINQDNFKNIFEIQTKLINDLFLVKAITDAFNNSHEEEKINLENYVSNYLHKLDEKIFEKIGKKEFFCFFNKIFDLIEKNEDKKKILNEKLIINYAFNSFLSEKKLEKRIFYLTEINNIIISTEYNDLSQKIYSSKKKNQKSELTEEILSNKKFLDRNKDITNITSIQFCKICHEKNIINHVLSNNSHEEIIKRLYPILKIMYINNFGFEENDIEKINELKENLFKGLFQRLKSVEKNNEVLWQTIQEIIINFTECLIDKDKYKIFLSIKNYFEESLNNDSNKHSKINNIFNLMINFTLKSIEEIKEENEIIDNFSEEKFYCLNTLLLILIDKKRIEELNKNFTKEQKKEIINLSIKGIIDIFKKTNYNEKLIKLITEKIMNTIFNLTNIIQNIILLEELYSKNILFKEALDEFCSKKTDEEMIALINELNTISNINKEEELYEYEFKLGKILDFIFLLFQSSNYIKSGYEKINIFNILFSSDKKIKKLFMEKIIKSLSFIKYDIKIYIFENILTNPNSSFEIKEIQSYLFLKEFIINLNTYSNKFNYITENDFIVLFEKIKDIFGYEKLFQILLNIENNEIQNDIQDLITDIYLGVKFSSREKYKYFWNEIVTSLINELKNLVMNNEENKNNNGIKGIIGLFKKIIEKSNNDGEIIKNKQIINSLMDKVKNNLKEKENNDEVIKVLFNYIYFQKEEKEKNINTNTKIETEINEPISIKKECEIYANEFFYYLRYNLSYEFQIPLKCIQISLPSKEGDSLNLNLLEDYFPIYNAIKSIYNPTPKKNEPMITIIVKKIINPLNEEKNANIKNIIKSNKELLSIFRDLLKKRNSNNTLDILEIVKDNDDFIKKGIFDDFNKLITEPHLNTNLLNELFNFNDASIFYKNLIMSNLYEFIQKNEANIVNKFIKSDIWENKLKNIDIKNIKKESKNEEAFEEIKYIYNILNIYKTISIELNKENNINEDNNKEIINSKIFDIYYLVIKDCIDDKKYNEEIINIYYEIIDSINELYKNNESLSFAFINYILKEKEKMFEDIKYCFIDGILKNKFPFINNKIQEFILSLIKNKIFNQDKDDIKDIRNNFYLFISTIFFDKSNDINKNIVELFNNIDDNTENIYIYNIKSFHSMLSEILFNIYKYTLKQINYENYIIELVIPYIYEPLIKKSSKYSNKFNDIYFGTQCIILYTYIQLLNISHISKEHYDLIFNHKGKNLKKYLFEEIIMLNCDKDNYKNISQLKNSLQIFYSLKEANHLFICLLIKDVNNNNDLLYYLEKIKYYNTLNYWFGDKISDWKLNFNYNEDNLSSNEFIGLKNLGCTCYMNSLMQTFYSIIPLRESFLRIKIEQKTKNSLYEVQKLFFSLKYCKEKFYIPESFVNNYDNEKLNVHQQMDIDEFFSNLIDKLENRLKNSENENIIKYFFQGRLNDVLTFQEGCSHHRTNISNFYSIQLQIRNKKSLYESLDTLIEGELMNEDNCIFCPECNKKMPAVKSQNFKTLPRMLIFVLKRFEFDFNTMNRIKINDYYEFPVELDMNKYTSEYLNNKDNINNLYKLKSIVIHQGHCEGGHYYAFIRNGITQEWHQFNDTNVTEFDKKDIPKEAYGGNSNKNAYLLFYEKEDMNNCEKFEKIKEIDNLENNKNEENINNVDEKINNDNINDEEGFNLIKDNNEINNENVKEKKETKEEIDVEDIRNNLNKKLFSKNYHHLTLELYLNVLNMIDCEKTKEILFNENNISNINYIHPIEKQLDLVYKPKHLNQNIYKYYKEGKLKIFNQGNKSVITFNEEEIKERNIQIFEDILLNYFNVIIRSEERKYLGCFVDLIKSLVINYDYCANYLLEEFTNYNVIMEYLKNCPLYEIKKITVGIIYYAMITSINSFQKNKNKNVNNNNNQDSIFNAINKINENIITLKSNIENLNLDENKNKIDTFGFEEFQEEEISESRKYKEDLDTFEVIDKDQISKASKQAKEDKGPMTKHYIDIIEEDINKNKVDKEKDKDLDNDTTVQNNIIPKNVIDFIYNIIYAMKEIKFVNYIESRFLLSILLKFSQINDYTHNFLIKNVNMLLVLNILLFQKMREKNYSSKEVFSIGREYINLSPHQILNPKPGEIIKGEYDKFTNINLKYDFLLLCSLSYEKEKALDEIYDTGFSFHNKNYILELIKSVDTKQEINYLSNLIKKKCFNNKEIFNNVLSTLVVIIDKINDSEDAFYDKFEQESNSEIYRNSKKRGSFLKRLRSNIHIILINLFELRGDNLGEYRQKEIFNELFNMFRNYKRYYSICLYIINIIIDIYLRGNDFVKKKLKNLNEVKDWLEKNKIAPKLYQIKGIEMYKDTPIHSSLYIDLKNITEVNQKLKDDFDKEEIAKTNKKVDYINKILNGLGEKSDIDMDLSAYNFDIGDSVIYENKKYEVIEVMDEMIKIKEIKKENSEKKFEVKGYKNKIIKKGINKKGGYLWIEKDNYKLKIL